MRSLALAWLVGCAGAQAGADVVSAAHQADVDAYAAEERACVALAATSGEGRDCFADVRQRWCSAGAPLALLGACGDSGLSPAAKPNDGGHE